VLQGAKLSYTFLESMPPGQDQLKSSTSHEGLADANGIAQEGPTTRRLPSHHDNGVVARSADEQGRRISSVNNLVSSLMKVVVFIRNRVSHGVSAQSVDG
jgi:hypothetical protein